MTEIDPASIKESVCTLSFLLRAHRLSANDASPAYNLLGYWTVHGRWSPKQFALARQLIERRRRRSP